MMPSLKQVIVVPSKLTVTVTTLVTPQPKYCRCYSTRDKHFLKDLCKIGLVKELSYFPGCLIQRSAYYFIENDHLLSDVRLVQNKSWLKLSTKYDEPDNPWKAFFLGKNQYTFICVCRWVLTRYLVTVNFGSALHRVQGGDQIEIEPHRTCIGVKFELGWNIGVFDL